MQRTAAYRVVDRSQGERLRGAIADVNDGASAYAVWGMLGWQDIKQRYRRSVIGPFWFTLSTAIMVGMLGVLYGQIFGQPVETYLPYVAVGMVVWALMSTLLIEGCTVFIASDSLIKQVRAPLTVHVCRLVWRNLIIFLHNAVIIVAVWLVYSRSFGAQLALVPVAIALYALNGLWAGILLGVFCTRFRDIAPTVANLVQVAFFATPIMWLPELLRERAWMAEVNPLHHYIELMRAPVLGQPFPAMSWLVSVGITAIGCALAVATLARFRHRVAYWL